MKWEGGASRPPAPPVAASPLLCPWGAPVHLFLDLLGRLAGSLASWPRGEHSRATPIVSKLGVARLTKSSARLPPRPPTVKMRDWLKLPLNL